MGELRGRFCDHRSGRRAAPETEVRLTERLSNDDKSVRLITKRFINILSECQALHMSASNSKLRMGRSTWKNG